MPSRESIQSPEQLRRLVCDSLRRELESRRDRAPHAQLGIVVGADEETTRQAFSRLHAHFAPGAYAPHGAEAAELAREISGLVQAAFLQLGPAAADNTFPLTPVQPMPRPDETLRALETLRGSIARRKAEALRLHAAGRLTEARRMFESVLRLDPKDEVARAHLRGLRIGTHRSALRLLALVVRGWIQLRALARRMVRRRATAWRG